MKIQIIICISIFALVLSHEIQNQSSNFLEIERMSQDFEEARLSDDENLIFLGDPILDQQFADFLNALYGTNLGKDILNKCSKPYSPDPKSHDGFIAQFQKVNTNIKTLLTKKTFKDVTGAQCTYNTADPNVFINAKKVEIPTTVLFNSYIFKNSFGVGFMQFSNCIGKAELAKISDSSLVDEIFYMFSSDKITSRWFESYCSVNNIFYYLKNNIDAKDSDTFKNLGSALNGVLKSTKSHYEFIKK